MELTLKRALKLRKEIEAALAGFKPQLVVQHSLHSNQLITTTVEKARTVYKERLVDFTRLSRILAFLRHEIAITNANRGIESMLSDEAHLQRLRTVMLAAASSQSTAALDELNNVLATEKSKLAQPQQCRWDVASTALEIGVLDEAMRQEAIEQAAEIKRQLEDMVDKRTHANASNKITLAEGDVEFLRKLAIL